MNPILALALTACLVIAGHTMAFEDEQIEEAIQQEDFTDTGVGCIDCMEPMIEPASEPVIADTLPMMINE